jgi:hypothetical protein
MPTIARRILPLLGQWDFRYGRAGRPGANRVVNGPEIFEHPRRLGYEGIVSKRVDQPYRSGRTKIWLKTKNTEHGAVRRVREEFERRGRGHRSLRCVATPSCYAPVLAHASDCHLPLRESHNRPAFAVVSERLSERFQA